MTVFMFGIVVLCLILFAVLSRRINTLSAEVDFVRSLLDQTRHRLQKLESARPEPTGAASAVTAAPAMAPEESRTSPPVRVPPPPRPACEVRPTPPPLPVAPQVMAPKGADPNHATEPTPPAPITILITCPVVTAMFPVT